MGVAVVSMAKASEPEEGSERQKEPTEEVARGGRKVLRRWGEAYFKNAVLTRVFYFPHYHHIRCLCSLLCFTLLPPGGVS